MLAEFSVDDLFEVKQGDSRYTREYVRANQGEYPVYSATTDEKSVYARISHFDYAGDTLTWTRSGYAGRVVLRTGEFSVNGDAGVLRPRPGFEELLYLPYFVPTLSRSFSAVAVGRYKADGASDYTKVSLRNLRACKVSVPVDHHGAPDLEAQREIAGRYLRVTQIKRELALFSDELERLKLAVPEPQVPYATFALTDLFRPMKGDGSLTKQYVRMHPGQYPIYSGSAFRDEVVGRIDRYDFEGEYLTWAADGYAGPVFARTGRFSANSHAGILKPLPEMEAHLHLPFFEHALTPIFQEMAVGRFKPNGAPDYTRVSVGMAKQARIALPIREDGLPDIERQREVAGRIRAIEVARETLLEDIARLIRTDVVIEGMAAH